MRARGGVSATFAVALGAFLAGLAVAWSLKDKILKRLPRGNRAKAWVVLAAALVIAALFLVH